MMLRPATTATTCMGPTFLDLTVVRGPVIWLRELRGETG